VSPVKHAVIAAAGLGSRLGLGLPKCLVEIHGQSLIALQLEALRGISDIRIVVGYMEQAVIDAVVQINRDVTFVRNSLFRTTTTQDSYFLGGRGIEDTCLYLDADIIFDAESLSDFLKCSASTDLLIGITAAKTDYAVYACTRLRSSESMAANLEITSFSREETAHEWANVVAARGNPFLCARGAVFETLQAKLPAPAKEIICYEIDTEQDLRRAEQYLRSLPSSTK
jgi:NDP-sugar pyrophosphorylase family protein